MGLVVMGTCDFLFSMRDVSLTYPLAKSFENSSIVSRVEDNEKMIEIKVWKERIIHFYYIF